MAFQIELLVAGFFGSLALLGIWLSYRQARNQDVKWRTWAEKWFADFSTELAGSALVTISILLLVIPIQKQDRKEELIRLMSSSDDLAARQASENLYFLYEDGGARWDGSLRNRDFASANWSGLHLAWATLRGSDLSHALLIGTHIVDAELVDVDLSMANLSYADLRGSDMTGAIITLNTMFNERTWLPDGSLWAPGVDMHRFTDPTFSDFWDPCVLGRASSCW